MGDLRFEHFVLAAILSSLTLLAPPVGRAPLVEIEWQAPPDCGDRDELVARSEALLRRPLGGPDDPDVELSGRIEVVDGGYVLNLEFRRPAPRTREFRGASCNELLAAAALVLVVTVDPIAPLDDSPPPEAETETETETEPETQPPPVVPLERPPEPEPRVHAPEPGFIRLGAGLAYPLLPTVAGGPLLAIGLRHRALQAELGGALWLGGDARFETVPHVGARLIVGWVAPRLCGVPSAKRVEFPLCAGIELGGMRGRSHGVTDARSRTLAWLAAELSAAVNINLGRSLSLWTGVTGTVPLTRPSFTIAGLGQLYRAPRFVFGASVGLEVHFGAAQLTESRPSGQAGVQ